MAAISANPFGDLPLPPLRIPQLPCLLALPFHGSGVDIEFKSLPLFDELVESESKTEGKEKIVFR